jgi:hypothetical protein
MDKQLFGTTESPQITLTVNGNLTVKGWDESRVQIRTSSEEDLQLEQQDDAITINCNDNCTLDVPQRAVLILQTVNGNATLKSLEGDVTAQVINGNIDLRSVVDVVLGKVQGNVSAKDVDGNMNLGYVDGNLTVRDIQGDLTVQERVGGNLNFYEADGNAVVSADGNINLRLDPSPGNNYDFKANGNIVCRLAEDISAEIFIERAEKITVNLPSEMQGLEEGQWIKRLTAPYKLVLGEGDAQIKLASSANVILGSEAPEWDFAEEIDFGIDEELSAMGESITEQVEQQLESQMELLEQQLEIQMEMLSARLGRIGLANEETRRIEERSRQAAERATQRAQEKIRRAQERLEQKLAASQRKAEQKARIAARKSQAHHRHSFQINIPTPSRLSAEEPVSDDERLMILRMLEEKKITAEEAEQLLSAIEGKEA